MQTVKASLYVPTLIGRRGENRAVTVVFDCIGEWRKSYGPGTVQLIAQRSGDDAPYPVTIETDETSARWVVTAADTAFIGLGECELQYFAAGETLVKSVTYQTKVAAALGTPSEAPPEPWEDWVEDVLTAKQSVDSFLETLSGGTTGQVWTKDGDTAHWANPSGSGGGASSWNDLTGKPFSTIGENLKVVGGALTVDTAGAVQQDNTKPITSAAVYTEVGNINALLALI